MEIRHLKLVTAIAEEGNLSRAALKLHLTQSALSHQLINLEKELGAKLFLRAQKKLHITREGQIVLDSAQEILGKLHYLKKEVKSQLYGESGEIRISTECYTSYRWLPKVMTLFAERYPGVDITIHPEFTYHSIQHLLQGHVDLVITDMKPRSPKIVSKKLFTDDVVAIVSKQHVWNKQPYVRARDFQNQTLLIYAQYPKTVLFPFLQKANVSPAKTMVIRLTESAVELVQYGLGVKAIALWAVESYLKTHEINTIKIGKRGLRRTWYVAFRKGISHKAYFDHFISLLKESLKPL